MATKQISPPTTPAQKWFEQGMEEHGSAKAALQSIKTRALTAGYFFAQARAACPHGEWTRFVESQKCGIPERTLRRYMEFYTDAVVTVIGAKRGFTDAQLKEYQPTEKELGNKKILEDATSIVIHSSQGFVELSRELGLFRKFGEYDAVKHAAAVARAAKAGAPIQINFDFGVAMAGLRSLEAIDRAKVDQLPAEKLPELRDKLQSALAKVLGRIKEITFEAEEVVS